MPELVRVSNPPLWPEYQGIVRVPEVIDREARYALQAVFTEEGALHVTEQSFQKLKKMSCCSDSLELAPRQYGVAIDGYLCDGDEIEFGSWAFANLLHETFDLEIDIVRTPRITPLPIKIIPFVRTH